MKNRIFSLFMKYCIFAKNEKIRKNSKIENFYFFKISIFLVKFDPKIIDF